MKCVLLLLLLGLCVLVVSSKTPRKPNSGVGRPRGPFRRPFRRPGGTRVVVRPKITVNTGGATSTNQVDTGVGNTGLLERPQETEEFPEDQLYEGGGGVGGPRGPVKRSVRRPIRRPIARPARRPIGRPARRPIRRPIRRPGITRIVVRPKITVNTGGATSTNQVNTVVYPIGLPLPPQYNTKDLNTCEKHNPCEQICVNIPGSVTCKCRGSYAIDLDDITKCNELIDCTDLVDIVFLIDESGSIGIDNFKVQQKFVAKLTEHFTVGSRGARFAAVLFATKVTKLFDLDTFSSQADIASSLIGAEYGEGGTNTHLGLNYIADNNMFSPSNGGRANAPDVVFALTDGGSSNPPEMKRAAARLKNQGVRVVAVGIGDLINTDELVEMASSSEDVFVVDDFALLDYIEESLTSRICPSTSE